MKQNKHRLPKGIKPIKYQLQITPNMSDFSFAAEEKIKISIDKSTKQLILHSLDLNIISAVWIPSKITQTQTRQTAKISYNKKSETVTFKFSKSIINSGTLDIKFNGVILEGLQGFYRSKYLHNKQEKFMAVTQLEATDARRFFPCFDEPAHKAVFQISVVVPKHLSVISNTIESKIDSHHDSSLKIVHFETTPKMSTYLLALIIGELEQVKIKSKNGVLIRIHTTHGKQAQTKFALDVTKRALDFLEDYFGIPYPLPVLDLIAIPDFGAGAMENWGAITFRETGLLVDEQHTTFIGRQRVAEVIAHELVHQWFGNLVTMEWWTHLWLNESFATYMAYVTVDKLFPEWNFWTKFVLEEQSTALKKDALHTSQPVEVEVKLPSEISESFDPTIVYAKGASVLRMLASYVGPQDFQKSLAWYLKKHSYKNTTSLHLWEAFEKISGKPVRQFMNRWTKVIGYPVVDVKVNNNNLIVSQSKFNQIPTKIKKSSKQLIWPIPLLPIFRSSLENTAPSLQEYDLTLNKTTQQFKLPLNEELIKLNSEEESFFITNYSIPLLAKILVEIRAKKLSSIERLAIIRNGFLLAKSGHISTDLYLEMLQYLTDETSYIVWSEVSSSLNQLTQLTHNTKAQPLLRDFKRNFYGNLIARPDLGFKHKPSDSSNNKTLRALAFLESGLAGYKPSIKEAKRLFAKAIAGTPIDADLRLPVYYIIADIGKLKQYNQLLNIFRVSTLAQEQQQILAALTQINSASLQKRALQFFFGPEVRDQDRHTVLSYALNTPSFKLLAWKEIQAQWGIVDKKYGTSKMFGRIISGAGSFNSAKELRSFQKFVASHKLQSVKQAVRQTEEKIKIKVAWKDRDLALIWQYLVSAKKAK